MYDPMRALPGLSAVCGKTIVVNFDGGLLSSDGGVVVLREVEQRLGVADRMEERGCRRQARAVQTRDAGLRSAATERRSHAMAGRPGRANG
jgi:hypothetical protein